MIEQAAPIVIDALRTAIRELYQVEIVNLRRDVAERTICGRLAQILTKLFPTYAVDVELNRRGNDYKHLEMLNADGEPERKRIYPDIVVHSPGHDDANLLVIEVKKTTNMEPDDFDLKKLAQIKAQIGYRFAVFLRISTGSEASEEKCRVQWI